MDLREEAKKRDIGIGSLVEINLLKGANFNMIASSFPCVFNPETPTELRGETVSGYIIKIDAESENNSYFDVHPSPNPRGVNLLGGFRVYSKAVHSFNTASSKK